MNTREFILLFLLVMLPYITSGTVGGPQLLNFLGHKQNSLYFIYEYHDQSGNPPELWRYDIQADSLFISKQWIDYPDESIEEALKRHNLDLLNIPDTIATEERVNFSFGSPEERYMEWVDLYYDLYPVKVKWGSEECKIYQCYDRENQPEVVGSYTFENHAISMAIVRYKGICFEAGYLKDTILIKAYRKKEIVEPQSEESDAEEQVPLIIGILVLSVVLMLIILLRDKKNIKKKSSKRKPFIFFFFF